MQQTTTEIKKQFIYLNNWDTLLVEDLIDKYNYCISQKGHDPESFELEIRFGEFNAYRNNRFKPSIDERSYLSIFDFFSNKFDCELIEQVKENKQTDENDIIKIETLKELKGNSDEIKSVQFIKKEKIYQYDIIEYGLRVCFSKEHKVDLGYKMGKVNWSIFKDKKRFYYNGIFIDLVKTIDAEGGVIYSCELELNKVGNIGINKLFDLIYEIMKIIQNSETIISRSEKETVLEEYKKVIGMKGLKFIGTQPHTLKLDKLRSDEKYALTYKYDGTRSLLFVSDAFDGVGYLISNKFTVTKTNLTFIKPQFTQMIFDGELFEGVYYIFDLLYYNSERVSETASLRARMKCVTEILDLNSLQDSPVIKAKEYVFPENLYSEFTGMIKELNNYPNYDGIIFAPIKNRENITLKWKPIEMNTVDFRVKILKEDKCILLCTTKNGEDIYEYSRKGIEIVGVIRDKNVIKRLINDRIYEFSYDPINEEFSILRLREDKVKPNFIEVVNDNLESVLYPINLDLIKRNQEKFYNLKRFHNWVKRIYISKHLSHKNVIDIACGRGGDIQKWLDNKIKKVDAYDKNEESIAEAQQRYSRFTSNSIYKTGYNYKFEIKDLITKDNKIDQVDDPAQTHFTAFFCMHYMIDDFDTFYENIKHNLTDGSLFICTFQSSNNIEKLMKKEKAIVTNEYELKRINANTVNVLMKETIVNESRNERIISTEDFMKRFCEKNFKLLTKKNFGELYKDWQKYNNCLEDYEFDISFLNDIYVFKWGETWADY